MTEANTLVQWLEPLRRFTRNCIFVEFNTDKALCICLFTAEQCYRISVVKRGDDGRLPYLGCTAFSRLLPPGDEVRVRCHLLNGDFTKQTFDEIVAAIAAFELKEIGAQAKSRNIEADKS